MLEERLHRRDAKLVAPVAEGTGSWHGVGGIRPEKAQALGQTTDDVPDGQVPVETHRDEHEHHGNHRELAFSLMPGVLLGQHGLDGSSGDDLFDGLHGDLAGEFAMGVDSS